MFSLRIISLVLAAVCLLGLAVPVLGAEVECDATYCFTSQDFSRGEDPLAGICITGVPTDGGTVLLGNRVLQPGDILTASQVEQMTFQPFYARQDRQAVMTYLPIYENRVEGPATMTLSIRGKEDLPPAAQDSSLETYKNLPNEGKLTVTDPEGKELTYTLVRQPRRGDVELRPDGTYTYTPKKNKVGVDSFTFTAADPGGNVSREATVTVQILKPTDARQYQDTVGLDCRFEAEWLRSTGLFTGEALAGEPCFQPDKAVTRGEFLAMLVKTLHIPTQEDSYDAVSAEVPQWLQPYLAAALRSGLMEQLPSQESGSFDAAQPITGAEAAVMVQSALDLAVTQQVLQTAATTENAEVPAWAQASMTILQEYGVVLPAAQVLTRADAAQLLYQVNHLAQDAPGMSVIRMQQ